MLPTRGPTPRPFSLQAYLQVLEDFVRTAGMNAPLREIVLQMSRSAMRFLGCDFVLNYTLEGDRLVPFVAYGLGPGQEAPPLVLEGRWGEQARTAREPILLYEGDLPEAVRALGARMAVLIPGLSDGERFSISWACFRVPRRFTDRQVRLMVRSLAVWVAAVALARSRRLETRRREVQSTLVRVLRAAVAAGDLDRMVRDLLQVMAEHFHAAFGLAWVVEEGRLVPRAGYGVDPTLYPAVDLERPEGVVGRAVTLRRPLVAGPGELESVSLPVSPEQGIRQAAAVPVQVGEEVVGAFSLGWREERPLSASALDLLGLMAGAAGPAILNARAVKAERQRLEELLAFSRIAGVLTQPGPFLERAHRLLEEVCRITEADWATLRLPTPDGQGLEKVATAGPRTPGLSTEDRVLPLEGSISGLAFRTGQPQAVHHYPSDPRAVEATVRLGVLSLLSVPIRSGGRVVGVLNACATRVGHFTPDRVRSIAFAADLIGALVEQARLLEAEQKARRRVEALEALVSAGLSTLNPDEAFRTVLARLVEASGGLWGLFRRWDPERGVLVVEALHNIPPEQVRREMPPGEGFSGLLLAEKKALLRRMADLPPALVRTLSPFFGSYPVEAVGGVPLYGRRGLLGVLIVGFPEEPAEPEEVLRLMQVAGERIALVLENVLAYRALQEQAMRDPLTGLLNRREFFRRLEEELARARRTGQPVSVLMVDLDRFKAVNETFGHVVGDRLLQELAERVLRPALRPYDVIARYGGDEFVVLLPGARKEDAERVGRRLQEALRRHTFEALPRGGWSIGLSVGLATFPEDGDTATHLVERADDALRSAKVEGRGRVVAYSAGETPSPADLPDPGRLQGALADALLSALDVRVPGAARRAWAVARCARLLAERMGLGPEVAEQAYWTGLLRDVGQLVLPPGPFLRPPYTPEEESAVRRHPVLSASLLGAHTRFQGLVPALLAHHERWDGTGYPGRLRGEQIPLAARLVAGAELFVLTALDHGAERALRAVEQERGRALDPAVVDALLAHADALEALLREA